MPSLSSETFAADLEAGLVDVGTVTVTENGIVSINSRTGYDDDESRSFIFLDSVDEIRAGITIDDAAWQSMWPGWTLEGLDRDVFRARSGSHQHCARFGYDTQAG